MKKVVPLDAVLIPEQAQLAFQGEIFSVYQWPQQMFDGSIETFEMLRRADTVTAVCVVDDKVLVIDDEQPHTGSRKSLPGGRVDKTDENIVTAAKREVREETGYSFRNWRLIKVWQPHTKLEWFIHLLLAWDVESKGEPTLDAGEKIILEELPFDKVKELVINKSGYLGESTEIFKELSSLEELLTLPEFAGQTIER